VTSIAMLFRFPVQNLTEIGQSSAQLWLKIFIFGHLGSVFSL